MAKLMIFKKGTCQVALNPDSIFQVNQCESGPAWTILTLHSGHEHCVLGEFDAVIARINDAKEGK